MKLGKVTGTVTATAKNSGLVGLKLLLVDVVDGKGKVLQAAQVAADTCGAGIGDTVMIVSGSAARMPASTAGLPIDNSIIAIVDTVSTAKSS